MDRYRPSFRAPKPGPTEQLAIANWLGQMFGIDGVDFDEGGNVTLVYEIETVRRTLRDQESCILRPDEREENIQALVEFQTRIDKTAEDMSHALRKLDREEAE